MLTFNFQWNNKQNTLRFAVTFVSSYIETYSDDNDVMINVVSYTFPSVYTSIIFNFTHFERNYV